MSEGVEKLSVRDQVIANLGLDLTIKADRNTLEGILSGAVTTVQPKPGESVQSGEVRTKDATPGLSKRVPRKIPPY